MSKINIKIVEVDQDSHTVLVKYASEKSQKPIDEYPAIAFQVTNYIASTPAEFIEANRVTANSIYAIGQQKFSSFFIVFFTFTMGLSIYFKCSNVVIGFLDKIHKKI